MKHIVWVRYILMSLSVLAIVFGWAIWGKGEAAGNVAQLELGVDLLLSWMYVILTLGVAAMVLMSLFSLAQNPKSAVQSLLGLGAVLIVIGVAFALSSGEPIVTPTKTYDSVTALKVADTSLIAMYILLGAALVAILLGEVRNAFK